MDKALLTVLADFKHKQIFVDCDKLAQYTLGNSIPGAVVEPESVPGASALLQACHKKKAVVNIWGSGQHQKLGIINAYDIALSTKGLNKISEFSPENMTISVQSGVTLAELQTTARTANLFLPLNPPNAANATLGGIAAANQYGSYIQGFGSMRDFMLGGKAVLADGQEIKFGGKTVKNVAGYDMCKLFTGSMGTIGLLTELTCKLWPLPEHVINAQPVVSNLSDCEKIVYGIRHKALPLLASEMLFTIEQGSSGNYRLSYDYYTPALTGEQCLDYLKPLLPQNTVWYTQNYKDYNEVMHAADDYFKLFNHEILLQWIVPKGQLFVILARLQHDSAHIPGSITVYSYPASGIFYTKMNSGYFIKDGEFTSTLDVWRKLAHQAGGQIKVEKAPDDIFANIEVWDVSPSLRYWSQKIKTEFDPAGVFVGGRFA